MGRALAAGPPRCVPASEISKNLAGAPRDRYPARGPMTAAATTCCSNRNYGAARSWRTAAATQTPRFHATRHLDIATAVIPALLLSPHMGV